MTQEEIVRMEAIQFYEWLDKEAEVINEIKKIKVRLQDFYQEEYKAFFIDELKSSVITELEEHRKLEHNGNASPTCQYEIDTEKKLFYLDQELSILPTLAKSKLVEKPKFDRNSVFVSYSRKNTKYLERVKRQFKPFFNKIEFWDDSKIEAGKNWKNEIVIAINKTKVAIFLVTADFLGSEFISSEEVPPLLEAAEKDGATILIMILEPVLFEEFPHLNKYQTLNPPSKPFITMSYEDQEELIVNLVRQTKKIIDSK